MNYPIQITYSGCDASEALTSAAHKRAEHLQQLHPTIMACRVAVELPHHHHQHGNLYCVRVDLTVNGKALVVSGSDEDPYVALRKACDVAARRLEERARRLRALTRVPRIKADSV